MTLKRNIDTIYVHGRMMLRQEYTTHCRQEDTGAAGIHKTGRKVRKRQEIHNASTSTKRKKDTSMIPAMEWVLNNIVEVGILVFELMGVGIIVWTSFVSFCKYVTNKPDVRIYLGKGLAMGLEFKIGSEILRTVVVREWKEISIVAGIIALRAALTFLIHWEIKEEEKEASVHKEASAHREK